ncbi:MAG: hypothetical protein LUF88_02800 [Bacteroides fragilis]|nr:hypothetical protein [Bacteroides fragilis]
MIEDLRFIYLPYTDYNVDAGYDAIHLLEEEDLLPNHIYSMDSNLALKYQFELKEYAIMIGAPEETSDQNIILAPAGTQLDGYYYVQLDDNECILTTDVDVYDFLTSYEQEIAN